MLGCATTGLGRPAGEPSPAPEEGNAAPLFDPTLPYRGYGSVAILDEGSLIITLGGEEQVAHDTDEEGEPLRITVSPSMSIAYQLDTSGLSLVQHKDAEVFLDRNGAEIARRGLRPEQVTKTTFRRGDAPESASNSFALLSLAGYLTVALHGPDGTSTLSIVDEDTGRKFSFTGSIESPDTVKGQGGDSEVPAGAESSAQPDTLVILWPTPSEANTNCQVTCVHGSCNVNCDRNGCKAFCHGGNPVCYCLSTVE